MHVLNNIKRIGYFYIVLALLLANSFQRTSEKQTKHLPQPAGGEIPIYEGHKEGEGLGDKRRAWFEMIHRTAPGVNWRLMDRNFRNETAKKRQYKRLKTKESFANGLLEGEWIERGSLNQAGNLVSLDYLEDTDEVYGISGGGTLWKSKTDGSSWTPLNESLQFEPEILRLTEVQNTPRILACQGKQVYYSDDDGQHWSMSSGLNFGTDWGIPISIEVNQAGEIYYLAFTWDFSVSTSEMWLYYSNNKGQSFSKINEFSHNGDSWPPRQYTRMWSSKHLDEVYIVHLGTEVYSVSNGSTALITNNSGLPASTPIDFEGSTANGSLDQLFVLSNNKQLYTSVNGGLNWSYISDTNTNAWEVGISVKEWDDDIILYGEVHCYRTSNQANSWTRLNHWNEYYSNTNKLHADIMDIQFFKKTDGTDFVLVSNHGGLHISYNDGQTFENISEVGLNIGQYYDVRTDLTNNNYVYVGSQDQGHQRSNNANSTSIIPFTQVISGDYGHMAFSRNNLSLWTNYPGVVHYYYNAKTGQSVDTYQIPGTDPAVRGWIAPSAETASTSDNSIYVAGGEINGGAGSYVLKLTASTQWPYNITATQINYDFMSNSDDEQSTIAAIANSKVNANKLFVTTSDGTFFYSNNAGNSWSKASSFNGPEEIWIIGTTILPSTINANTLWLGGSGYSNPAVYKSTNGGASFSAMSTGLPNTLVYDLAANEDESLLFAGAELGPYVYVVNQNRWYPLLGQHAPLQQYNSVEYLSADQIVRFGTYGRGMWDFHLDKSCEIYSSLSNSIYNDTLIQVKQTIESSSIVNGNVNVTYDAGISIELKNGFEVRPTAVFEAEIKGCN